MRSLGGEEKGQPICRRLGCSWPLPSACTMASGEFRASRRPRRQAAGSAQAQISFERALALDTGVNGAPNAVEAYAEMRRAADAGHPDAAFNVAVMLDSGRGAPRGTLRKRPSGMQGRRLAVFDAPRSISASFTSAAKAYRQTPICLAPGMPRPTYLRRVNGSRSERPASSSDIVFSRRSRFSRRTEARSRRTWIVSTLSGLHPSNQSPFVISSNCAVLTLKARMNNGAVLSTSAACAYRCRPMLELLLGA